MTIELVLVFDDHHKRSLTEDVETLLEQDSSEIWELITRAVHQYKSDAAWKAESKRRIILEEIGHVDSGTWTL